ncbi:50S ribosomal protein L30 [Pseudobacteriovorax antillogorgiicola]|uniref:50S ribosomal protein L30 n=1 Tax=Pseudobacteriovorax antillogorgiicola TaxID=1513793 RepID=A0A1Y6B774_9BACT|nr:50S ribosomal protein L30 [Pseudobacteriovorax antillogorgiicola]TCS59379.1 large subunit ribosomal protein L30 [Pseudobacteriovorax antillogorgiicola]SME88792.1 large subunit ribosomal protein L30 [Pseudobacteriovorax antillogorgiicola]
MSKIVVRQKKSLIGSSESLRKVVKALGLGKIGQERTHKDNNCTRGMVNKVRHLVEYELVSE